MNTIYALRTSQSGNTLERVWTQGETGGLADGYTSGATATIGGRTILFAYNATADKLDAYVLSGDAPQAVACTPALAGGPWDSLNTFILGNEPHLLAYRRHDGMFAFFHVADDLTLSPPYTIAWSRNTPTTGFTSVAPFTSLGQQFILGYDADTGTVANFSLGVTSTSSGGTPPLLLLNAWYHQWAKGWRHFAFFQLGGANFFFKINTAKLNVNIDHIQDNPAMGTVEVGSYLQGQLPDALKIDIAATVPWADGDIRLLTYIAASGATAVYRIHGNCMGWTSLCSDTTPANATLALPYRTGDTSFVLFYATAS